MKLIAATQNKNKLVEIEDIIKDFDMELVSMGDAGLSGVEIEETGKTLEENSLIKARTVCEMTGEAAIADDTGLMVKALGGAPGVYSARFAGEHGDDAANRALLLKRMEGLSGSGRAACFASVITVYYPDGRTLVARGECPGVITEEERGSRGFGYDSIFMPKGKDKTFAQLSLEEKDALSHRGRALRKLHEMLMSDIM